MIKAEHLNIVYPQRVLFSDFSLEIKDGEIIGIIGPSGSGKSTLLRVFAGLTVPDSGTVELNEKPGMVFNEFNLFPHMSLVENVMSGMVHGKGEAVQSAFEKAMDLLREVGLYEQAFTYPNMLSGSQQQRACIARTLALDSGIILLDEPTSSLDPMSAIEVEAVIRNLCRQGKTVIISSNEMNLIRQNCSRVLFVADGGIYEEGSPEEIFEHPRRDLTRRFVSGLRVLEFTVDSKNFDFIGASTRITEYAFKHNVPADITERLRAVMEELFQMLIIQPKDAQKMSVTFEYNSKNRVLGGTILASGPAIDDDDPMYFISWPIIKMRSSGVEVKSIDLNGYTNEISITIA